MLFLLGCLTLGYAGRVQLAGKTGSKSNSDPIVKIGTGQCLSTDDLLRKVDSVELCAQLVEAAGGKYFSFNKLDGSCLIEYDGCLEGASIRSRSSPSTSYYDIPSVDPEFALQCSANVFKASVQGHEGLMGKSACGLNGAALLNVTGKRGQGVCRQEYRLGKSGSKTVVQQWETCCHQPACHPEGALILVAIHDLDISGTTWTYCRKLEDVLVAVVAPTKPALPVGLSVGKCFTVELASKTKFLWEMYAKCPLSTEEVDEKFIRPYSNLVGGEMFDIHTRVFMNLGIGSFIYGGGRFLPASQRIRVPSKQKFVDRVTVFNMIGIALEDIDEPGADRFGETDACINGRQTEFPIVDSLNDSNRWEIILGHPAPYKPLERQQWVQSMFHGAVNLDGDPVYPTIVTNYAERYLVDGIWKDEGETFAAWNLWGAHRLEPSDIQGAAYMYKAADLGVLRVRPGFSRVGADMYFDEAGVPVMVGTPEGEKLWRSEVDSETWQYWKFVWRSSGLLKVILVDHLWCTHLSAANGMVGASRDAMPPKHPLRRLVAMFTALTPRVNQNALDQLVGPHMSIQRLQPWEDLHQVALAARSLIPPLKARFGHLADVEQRAALPKKVLDTPYFTDGQLYFDALKELVDNYFAVHAPEWCSEDGFVVDKDFLFFYERLESWSMYVQDHIKTDGEWLQMFGADGKSLRCEGFQTWLAIHFFHVSGFHRHVGMVGDSLADPEWAAPSWVQGERYARPQQQLLLGIVSASTGTSWPKIIEDYSFMFAGINRETQTQEVMTKFNTRMKELKVTIDKNNEQREVPYIRFDPHEIETAVAV